jgi:hypothetical protein
MATTSPGPPRVTWRTLSRPAKLWALAALAALTLGGLELAARAYWAVARKVPFAHTGEIWKAFFPEWARSGVDGLALRPGDGTVNVLLLGGSALTDGFGSVGRELTAALESRLGVPVRVVNLAELGRTSRDSRIKYDHLAGKSFDLVVNYDGFNDAFLNNVPAGAFRPNYSHAPRFDQLRLLEKHRAVAACAFPYTARYLVSMARDKLMLCPRPRREWHHYGADVRTPPSYRANLEWLAAAAERRGEPLVLQTYAYYIPPDYSEAAFTARTLDYGAHISPVAQWGEPAYVAAAVDAHNAAVRDLAARHPGVTFVDQQALIPKGKAYFNDCCHLTDAGCKRFVENLLARVDVAALARRVAQPTAASGSALAGAPTLCAR